MKALLLLFAPLALASSLLAPRAEIAYEPEEDTVLERSFVAELDMDLVGFGVEVDGEELPVAELELTIRSTETIVVTDELVGVEDGRPTELVRTFDELSQESAYLAGDEETEKLSRSDLQGRTLRFEWDEDAEYYTVEADDDEGELDEETATWLDEDMDLRAILPEDEVEVGDTWEVDESLYLPLMWPGGLLGFYDDDEDEVSEFQAGINRQTIENLTGEGEVTFEDIRDEDGVRVAVLRVELEVSTEVEATDDRGPSDIEIRQEMVREIEGVVLWDLDHGHLYSAEFEAGVEMTVVRARQVESPEGEAFFDVEETEDYAGTISYTVTIERDE